ncbi:MAG: hypothetical protein CMF70_07740 [Magnetovibrio sp.]|nr:hypothetical protein [Magnetovibrio sp.]
MRKINIKSFFQALLIFISLVPFYGETGATENNVPTFPPKSIPELSKSKITFNVYRKGEKIGFHQVIFREKGRILSVSSIFKIEINFLFFTAFHYQYQCRSLWKDGILQNLEATVDDDGKISFIKVTKKEGLMHVKHSDKTYTAPPPLFPTNHWNPNVLDQKRVLNTLTGHINEIKIEALGDELIETEKGDVRAKHFRYTGDLETDVWYDYSNRWVKMSFKGNDGSIIEYRCTHCQGPIVLDITP